MDLKALTTKRKNFLVTKKIYWEKKRGLSISYEGKLLQGFRSIHVSQHFILCDDFIAQNYGIFVFSVQVFTVKLITAKPFFQRPVLFENEIMLSVFLRNIVTAFAVI